jgi:single-stranded DNA-specific DHH superfamily exonuclease
MTQLTFDAAEAERQKEIWMKQTALSRKDILAIARFEAQEIARYKREVSADDVFAALRNRGFHPEDLGNAAGSIFAHGFEPVRRIKSKRVSNHSRWIFVWRLKR